MSIEFIVSQHPDGHRRWWSVDEALPAGDTYIRDASPEEAALITKVIRQDRAGRMPAISLGDRIREMLSA